jgi:PAS domain S-box-containing protein
MPGLHRLLNRQISKFLPEHLKNDLLLAEFLDAVNQAYIDFDQDHEQLERTLEISSNELFKMNQQLITVNLDLEQKVVERTNELANTNLSLVGEIEVRKLQELEKYATDLLLQAANKVSNELINSKDLDNGLLHSINIIGEGIAADRSYIYKKIDSEKTGIKFLLAAGWYCLNENQEDRINIENGRSVLFNKWISAFLSGQEISGTLKSFELEDAELLASMRINSIKVMPIFIEGNLWGILGLEWCKTAKECTETDEKILLNLINTYAGVIRQKSNEKSLEKTKQALLESQKFSKMGSFEIDFFKKTSFFTEQAGHLLGLSQEELTFHKGLAISLRKRVVPEDLEVIDKAWLKAIEERSNLKVDFRIGHPDGNIYYLNWYVNSIYSESGKLLRVSGTLQDITERNIIEQKSRTAKLIVENSPAVLFRWKLEGDYPVEYVSENISQFGYSVEDFISQEINYADIIHPEDFKRVIKEIDQYKNSGTNFYVQVYRIYNKDRKLRWVEDRTMVEVDVKGNATHHQGIISDITERVLAQNALVESENRFRSLVHNSSDITTILSAEGKIMYESPSFYRMFGFEENEILGKNVFDYLHPQDLEPTLDSFSKFTTSNKTSNAILFRFRNKFNEWIYLEAIANNLLNDDIINGIVVNSRDVTERVKNEQMLKEYAGSLEKINKELDQFAYIVSHDLKAPLRAINNLSIWIEEDIGDKIEADTQKNFNLLRGRIGRMEGLINGILDYSRAGRMKAQLSEIDLNVFIDEVVSNLAPPEKFKVKIQENLPTILAEKITIDQVFSNFISNAIKYNNNENPEIEINCTDKGDFYKFCFADNGPGIDKKYHEKIFQIFQTLQARDSVESTGVGLAIVKKIVEEKGGNVWVESELGKGSKFFFTLAKDKLQIK